MLGRYELWMVSFSTVGSAGRAPAKRCMARNCPIWDVTCARMPSGTGGMCWVWTVLANVCDACSISCSCCVISLGVRAGGLFSCDSVAPLLRSMTLAGCVALEGVSLLVVCVAWWDWGGFHRCLSSLEAACWALAILVVSFIQCSSWAGAWTPIS